MRSEVQQLLWGAFKEVREFFYEVACLDSLAYPMVNMKVFADLCLRIGQGFLRAKINPEPDPLDTIKQKTQK